MGWRRGTLARAFWQSAKNLPIASPVIAKPHCSRIRPHCGRGRTRTGAGAARKGWADRTSKCAWRAKGSQALSLSDARSSTVSSNGFVVQGTAAHRNRRTLYSSIRWLPCRWRSRIDRPKPYVACSPNWSDWIDTKIAPLRDETEPFERC